MFWDTKLWSKANFSQRVPGICRNICLICACHRLLLYCSGRKNLNKCFLPQNLSLYTKWGNFEQLWLCLFDRSACARKQSFLHLEKKRGCIGLSLQYWSHVIKAINLFLEKSLKIAQFCPTWQCFMLIVSGSCIVFLVKVILLFDFQNMILSENVWPGVIKKVVFKVEGGTYFHTKSFPVLSSLKSF